MQGGETPSLYLIKYFHYLGWELSVSRLRSGFVASTLADSWQA